MRLKSKAMSTRFGDDTKDAEAYHVRIAIVTALGSADLVRHTQLHNTIRSVID